MKRLSSTNRARDYIFFRTSIVKAAVKRQLSQIQYLFSETVISTVGLKSRGMAIKSKEPFCDWRSNVRNKRLVSCRVYSVILNTNATALHIHTVVAITSFSLIEI